MCQINVERENGIGGEMEYICRKCMEEKIGVINEVDEVTEEDKPNKDDTVVDLTVDAVEADNVDEGYTTVEETVDTLEVEEVDERDE